MVNEINNLDYLTNTRATLQIHGLDDVSFCATEWNLPGISLPNTFQPTPFRDIPIYGDKLEWQSLTVDFIVTSRLENWNAIFQWMVGLSKPTEFPEFCNKKFETTDATLHLYTGKQNKFGEVVFTNLVPTSLSGLMFSSRDNNITEILSSATFEYQHYKINLQ